MTIERQEDGNERMNEYNNDVAKRSSQQPNHAESRASFVTDAAMGGGHRGEKIRNRTRANRESEMA